MPPVGSPEEHLLGDEQQRELWRAVSSLSQRCQLLLRTIAYEPDHSYQDISMALSMPVGSIGPTRARCLTQLRSILDATDAGRPEEGRAMNVRPNDNSTLWREIRNVYDAVDPVPPEVTSVAYGAMAFRSLDAELGRLVSDSAEQMVGAVRDGEGPGRLVTFESESLTIEVQVSRVDADRHLVGQLVPPAPAEVRVEWPEGSAAVRADELGRFSVDSVPAGPVRLVCDRLGSASVVTGWLTL